VNDINIELFQQNPEKSFRLIAILNIDLKYPNNFKVLFKDIETGKLHEEKIIPELFRRKFKIGNIYQNNKVIKLGNYLQGKFLVDIKSNDKYQKFEDAITQYPYTIKNEYFLKSFNKQLCYTYEVDDVILIIPTTIIAIRYYFLSSSFKKAYNDGILDSLYHEFTNKYFSEEDRYQIDIKNANKKDIPFICRFLNDNYSRDGFTYFFRNKASVYKRFNIEIKNSQFTTLFSTLLCRFPVIGAFNIHCRYIPLINTLDDKKMYLVTDIYNDESPLGFSSLHVRKYKSGLPQGDIDNIPYTPKKYRGRKKGNPKDNTITSNNPHGNVIPNTLLEEVQKDLNTENLKITNENLFTGSGKAVEINSEEVNSIPSFNECNTTSHNNEYIQQILCIEIEKVDNPFLLSHFMILFEELRQDVSVLESSISTVKLIPKISNKVKIGFNDKSFLNKDENIPRPYLYGYIEYNDKFVYFIEIQEDASWQQSTWFFCSDSYIEFNEYDALDIIQKYLVNNWIYKDLYEYCYENKNISMFTKQHTKFVYDENNINRWVGDILNIADLSDEERYKKIKKSRKKLLF